MDKLVIYDILGGKLKGKDTNRLLTTIQGSDLKANTYGLKLDDKLVATLENMGCSPFKVYYEPTVAYLHIGKDEYIKVDYLLFNNTEVYIDFNTLEVIDIQERIIIKQSEDKSTYDLVCSDTMDDVIKSYGTLKEAIFSYDKDSVNIKISGNVISDFVNQHLDNMTKLELSEKTDIKYKTLINKLTMNTLTAEELLSIATILNMDLNELAFLYNRRKDKVKHDVTEEICYISSLIRNGHLNGLSPNWDLSVPTDDFYPLSEKEKNMIANQIEAGYRAGYLSGKISRQWQLFY